jgi:hypothetical protein
MLKTRREGDMTPIRDNRSVKLDRVYASDYIPLFAGRPKREIIIGKDDLLDVKILLNATHTVDEFIAKL